MQRISQSSIERLVYFIQAGESSGPIKIGIANDPNRRIVLMQTCCPLELRLLLAVPGSERHEERLHQLLKAHRIRGEWFEPHADVLRVMAELTAGRSLADLLPSAAASVSELTDSNQVRMIRTAMLERRMTALELASATGVDVMTISHWIAIDPKRRHRMNRKGAESVAKILGMDADALRFADGAIKRRPRHKRAAAAS